MTKISIFLTVGSLLASSAFAESHASGDAAAGEGKFNQCQTCHIVQNDDGETLAGRNAKTGPNLYEIGGRTSGTVEGFRYSKSMIKAGEAGLVWDEASFVAYLQDPTGFLREFLDDSKARGKMSYKVRTEEDALNLWAFIVSLSPQS